MTTVARVQASFWSTTAVDHREVTRAVGDREAAMAREDHPQPESDDDDDDDAGAAVVKEMRATNKQARATTVRHGRADRKHGARTARK